MGPRTSLLWVSQSKMGHRLHGLAGGAPAEVGRGSSLGAAGTLDPHGASLSGMRKQKANQRLPQVSRQHQAARSPQTRDRRSLSPWRVDLPHIHPGARCWALWVGSAGPAHLRLTRLEARASATPMGWLWPRAHVAAKVISRQHAAQRKRETPPSQHPSQSQAQPDRPLGLSQRLGQRVRGGQGARARTSPVLELTWDRAGVPWGGGWGSWGQETHRSTP